MDALGKTEAVRLWAAGWPELDGVLKLNAIDDDKPGDAAMFPTYNDPVITQYIDGTADRYYTVELRMVLAWSDSIIASNSEAARLMESWMDWVGDQFPGNVPDFGASATVTDIQPLQNTPAPALVFADNQTAEYSFSARIYYTE